MFEVIARRSLGIAIAAAVALAACGAAGAAAPHSCVRSGLKIYYSDSSAALLTSPIGGYYESGAKRYYACSRTYGRIVAVGEYGITADGPVWDYPAAVNARYAATVGGYGGNADGDSDTDLSVIDLKTGKRVRRVSSSASPDALEAYVARVVLSPTGALGWSVIYSGDDYKPIVEVYSRAAGRNSKARLLDRGGAIDPESIHWSNAFRQLTWTDSPSAFSYTPRTLDKADPLHGAECTRNGDRVLGRANGTVYLVKRFGAPGWSGGRVLIACSLTYHRRVALAHSGRYRSPQDGLYTYSFETPVVEEQFAGVVTRRTAEDGSYRETLMSYDLGNGDRLCLADSTPDLSATKVTKAVIGGAGDLAWLVSGRGTIDPSGPQQLTQLRVCDAKPARTLETSASLDDQYLRFNTGDGGPQIVVSEHDKFGP